MIRLLPYEKRLAQILGVSEETYQEWKAITLRESIERPAQGPVCGPIVPVLVSLAISVGITLLSSLLFPGQRQQSRIVATRKSGSPTTSNQRSSPRFGFDSLQEPARVGQFVPVIIAKRENNLGGVRVAMPLLWSQILAWKGSQMARAIFLAGSANMAANAWSPAGWAIGNNTLGAYSFTGSAISSGSRYSIYYSPAGGRITSSHHIAGRAAADDLGNSSNYGGQDVFAVRIPIFQENHPVFYQQYKKAFCMSEVPSTSKAFGLYGWCPNAMMRRPAVTIQPTIVARISPSDKVRTDDDAAALVELHKAKIIWSTRSGLRRRNNTVQVSSNFGVEEISVSVGDTILYVMDSGSDADTIIRVEQTNSRIHDNNSAFQEAMSSIASSVAALQNSADASLVPNELYRIGSCWAILEDRISASSSESIFISQAEQEPAGGGNSMSYLFRVVKAGSASFVGDGIIEPRTYPLSIQQGNMILPGEHWPADNISAMTNGTENRYKTCSQASQVFRMAVASVGAVRDFMVSEILIKSRVGITVSGMTGFRESPTIQAINAKAGWNQNDSDANGVLSVSIYTSSGSEVTCKALRYSAFILEYRNDRGVDWTEFPAVFAVAGITGEEVYNYLRTSFEYAAKWERRLVPISSWEIRKTGTSEVVVLDTNSNTEMSRTVNSTASGGQFRVNVTTTGYMINPSGDAKKRGIAQLEPTQNIGYGWSDWEYNSMFDGYARFAEAFPYDNLQTSVGSSPEHEIVQVNYYGELALRPENQPSIYVSPDPSYQSLCPVGLNIMAGLEISSLQSFSGFCNNGYEMPRLLNNDTKGASHLWPDWFREVMTSPELGAFPRTLPAQIDRASFQQAAQWCQDREYFYDAVEDEPLNILEWASETALAHLLKVVRLGGVYYLKKAVEFTTPLKIEAQFNNGNIEEGSFRYNSIDYNTRQPFIVQVKWREEMGPSEINPTIAPGSPLFARERVAMVRQANTSVNAPVKTLDLSKWCTNYKQAIDAACYYIRFVTIHDHQISFKTSPDVLAAQLRSGGFFIMDFEAVNYTNAVQGFIQQNGTIVSTRPWLLPAANGSYSAITWDMESDPQQETLEIANGIVVQGYRPPANINDPLIPTSGKKRFFAMRDANVKPRTYEIKKINIDGEGVITIDAFHHPTNANGVSLLGVNWTTYQTDSNWIIEL